jgi:hypothetical protein
VIGGICVACVGNAPVSVDCDGIAHVGSVRVSIAGDGIAGVALHCSLARGLRRVRRVTAGEATSGADVTPGVNTASAERRCGVGHDVFIPDRVAAAAEPRDEEEWM